jgi:hypothetical protein
MKLALLILATSLCQGQTTWEKHIVSYSASTSCKAQEIGFDDVGGAFYKCVNSSWAPTAFMTGGASVPSGLVTMILTGTCPTGWTEVSALNGVMLRGTVAANNDVGTKGGNATITPTGTVSQPALAMSAYTPTGTVTAPVFTGSQGTIPAETFTGNQGTTSAVSAGTPAGTNSTSSVATTSGSKAGSSTGAFTAIGGAAAGSNFTVPAETFTGSAMATHTHTLTPAGTNSSTTFTPAGTNSTPTFTGAAANLTGTVSQPAFQGQAIDPSPSYTKVIFCSKN